MMSYDEGSFAPYSSTTGFLANAVLAAASFVAPMPATQAIVYGNGISITCTPMLACPNSADAILGIDPIATQIISRLELVSDDADLRDEDEPAPPPEVLRKIREIIHEASALSPAGLPWGSVTTFYGEVNVTWKSDSKIVRLACFPDGTSKVQVGDLSAAFGSYLSEPNATGRLLVDALDEFSISVG